MNTKHGTVSATIKYEPLAGTWIEAACQEATEISKRTSASFNFEFNGVLVQVVPGVAAKELVDRWTKDLDAIIAARKASPEYAAQEAERQREIQATQAAVNSQLANLPDWKDLDSIIKWLEVFAKYADDSGVNFDKSALCSWFEKAGFKKNQHVGEPPAFFKTKQALGEWIVGQVMSCLDMEMPPHPITIKFAQDYFALKS